MKDFRWTSDLEIGIPPIDRQHKRIIKYIVELDSLGDNPNCDKVEEILDKLVDYTLSHFAFEEELMEESNYMFVNAHKRVHALFVRKVSSYVTKFKSGENITGDLLITLKTWLLNHIKNDDRDYGKAVRSAMKVKKVSWFKRMLRKLAA